MRTLLSLALLVAMTSTARALDELNWAPANHERLSRLIRDHGRGGKHHDPARPPYAVFDWDQTTAFLDCEEALFHFALANLELELTPDQLKKILLDEPNGIAEVEYHGGAQPRKVKLADVNHDVVAAWSSLRPRLARFGGTSSLEELRETAAFKDLVTKLAFLYEAYEATPAIGTDYAYRWILYVLAGRTPDDLRSLAARAFEASLADALGRVTWKGPRDLESRAGPIDHTFRTGLRVHPEMQNLHESLRAAGIEVFVVTASLKEVVEVFAAKGRFGYSVPADHVIGCELELEGGKLAPVYKKDWVLTYAKGKVEAIRRRLGSRGDPLLVAGDSDGDADMLTDFDGTKVSLILNRVKGGKIGALSKRAAEQRGTLDARFLLQGRNENTGLFVPSHETIPFGEREPRLLRGVE